MKGKCEDNGGWRGKISWLLTAEEFAWQIFDDFTIKSRWYGDLSLRTAAVTGDVDEVKTLCRRFHHFLSLSLVCRLSMAESSTLLLWHFDWISITRLTSRRSRSNAQLSHYFVPTVKLAATKSFNVVCDIHRPLLCLTVSRRIQNAKRNSPQPSTCVFIFQTTARNKRRICST